MQVSVSIKKYSIVFFFCCLHSVIVYIIPFNITDSIVVHALPGKCRRLNSLHDVFSIAFFCSSWKCRCLTLFICSWSFQLLFSFDLSASAGILLSSMSLQLFYSCSCMQVPLFKSPHKVLNCSFPLIFLQVSICLSLVIIIKRLLWCQGKRHLSRCNTTSWTKEWYAQLWPDRVPWFSPH